MTLHALPNRGFAGEFDDPMPAPTESRIPPFEGHKVDGLEAKLSGTSGLDLDAVHKIDDVARLLITGRVVGVHHRVDEKTGNLVRVETFKVVDALQVPFDALADAVDIDDRDPNVR